MPVAWVGQGSCGASMGCNESALSVNDSGQDQARSAGEWGTWPGGCSEGIPRGENTNGFGSQRHHGVLDRCRDYGSTGRPIFMYVCAWGE